MKEIKKNAKIKSKVKGKETPFNIDLNYSEEYDSFNIKVKKGEGFMSYTDSLQSLPLEVVQKLNEMLEEVLVKAGSETKMKNYDYDYADIGQFSLPDSERNKTEQQYIDLGKKIVNTKFKGDIGKAYDYVVRNKREFGGDFQAGVYAKGGSLEAHGIKEGDTFIKTISGVIQKVRDKDGKIVYINLANGERDNQPPLPFDNGGEVTYFVNKDGIRVRSKVEPKEKLSEKEWMAKHSDSKEARAYKGGGALVGNQKRIDMNHNGEIDAEDFKILRSSMNGAWRNERKHVNHNEDYEVRYARKKPSRTGYKEKRNFETGGKVLFAEKSKAIARNFVGKRVEPKYQKEYGKTYDAKEAKEVGNKIAGAQKASYDAKAEKGAVVKKKSGNPKMKEAMVLAKKIRKDGEKWTDAVKRAYSQIK